MMEVSGMSSPQLSSVGGASLPVRSGHAADLKAGLMQSLADLRHQSNDLSQHISTIDKESRHRVESDAAIISSIRAAGASNATRQLPVVPERKIDGADRLLEVLEELNAAQRDKDTAQHEIKVLQREVAKRDRSIVDLEARVAAGDAAGGTQSGAVVDTFKVLLQKRCEEVEAQLKHQEQENQVLLDRVMSADHQVAQLQLALQKAEVHQTRALVVTLTPAPGTGSVCGVKYLRQRHRASVTLTSLTTARCALLLRSVHDI